MFFVSDVPPLEVAAGVEWITFGSGVMLMGMPMVVVWLLLIVFHGLKDSFAATVTLGLPFVLLVVVLVATAVAVDSSSLSLLAALVFLFGGGTMVIG